MDTASFAHSTSKQHLANTWSSPRLRYVQGDPQDEKQMAAFVELWNNPSTLLTGTMGLMRPANGDSCQKRFQSSVEDSLMWACICLPDPEDEGKAGQVIGHTTLSPGAGALLQATQRASLGITIAPEFQGKGYGGEAIRWLLDWAFSLAGLHSVALGVTEFNTPAIELYKKIGFVQEGRQRQTRKLDGKWYDTIIMSVLEDEWRTKRE